MRTVTGKQGTEFVVAESPPDSFVVIIRAGQEMAVPMADLLQVVDQTCLQGTLAKLLTELAKLIDPEWAVEFAPDWPETAAMGTEGYEEGDERAPFWTETFLYNLLGKEDARTLLGRQERVANTAAQLRAFLEPELPADTMPRRPELPTVLTFDDFCAQQGGPSVGGDPARQQQREQLRQEYDRLVAAGQLRPPTLIELTWGDPEDPRTQAAQAHLRRLTNLALHKPTPATGETDAD